MDQNLICTTKIYYMIYFFELRTTIILLIPGDVSKHSLLHSKIARLTLALTPPLTPSSASMHHSTNNYSTYLMWVVKSQIRWNRKVYLHYYWEKCLLVFGCHRITKDIQCLIYHDDLFYKISKTTLPFKAGRQNFWKGYDRSGTLIDTVVSIWTKK